jgi:ribosomal protein S5
MVLVGQSQRLAEPLSRRQIRVMAAVGVMALLATVGVVAWLATHSSNETAASRNGCVNVIIPAATGGQGVHYCGAAARTFCDSQFGIHNVVAQTIDTQCRLAGIPPARRSRSAAF